MFDQVAPNGVSGLPLGKPPCLGAPAFDPALPFVLTRANTNSPAVLSGEARAVGLARFASLPDAMQGAMSIAEDLPETAAPLILAILDSDERLVLAGLASAGAVAWSHPVMNAAEARRGLARARSGAAFSLPRRSSGCPPRRSAVARFYRPRPADRGVTSERQRRAGGSCELCRMKEIAPLAPTLPPYSENPMTQVEPTLAAPMPPSTIDLASIFAAYVERQARIDALRPGNKDRLFDGLTTAGITHVTVTFDGEGDSGQIESIAAWAGETAVEFPAVEIAYAAITWDNPEVEMRQLSLEDVVEQLAYDFLSDTHGGWENNDGAYGEFCFDATARCIHLEFNERFTSSELYTHDF